MRSKQLKIYITRHCLYVYSSLMIITAKAVVTYQTSVKSRNVILFVWSIFVARHLHLVFFSNITTKNQKFQL